MDAVNSWQEGRFKNFIRRSNSIVGTQETRRGVSQAGSIREEDQTRVLKGKALKVWTRFCKSKTIMGRIIRIKTVWSATGRIREQGGRIEYWAVSDIDVSRGKK